MPDIQRQRVSAASDKVIIGITLEGETTQDIDNIGLDRRKAHRWEYRVSMRTLLQDIGAGRVDFIAFSPRAVMHVLAGNRGISNIPFVREQARAQQRALYDGKPIPTLDAAPAQRSSGHHTYRPAGFPTR